MRVEKKVKVQASCSLALFVVQTANIRVYQGELAQCTRWVDVEEDNGHTYPLPTAGTVHRNDALSCFTPPSAIFHFHSFFVPL